MKTIVFCFPGDSFSGAFLRSWSDVLNYCIRNDITPVLSTCYSNNIYFVRNMCLGGDARLGIEQKPFNGSLKYDYLMWIDSDIVFTADYIVRLMNHDCDIISGIYMMEDGKHFATVKDWNQEYFKQNGSFKFLTTQDIVEEKLIEVSYTGMGFMLVKYGVFEKLDYPWFEPRKHKIDNMVDYSMEDVAFCIKAREHGFPIKVDTSIRVGHVKKVVL